MEIGLANAPTLCNIYLFKEGFIEGTDNKNNAVIGNLLTSGKKQYADYQSETQSKSDRMCQ